jgi:AcrR family transcriptional regulator
MRRGALPIDDDVRAVAGELINTHLAGGAYPSVSALAKHFGINRTTFYRHYSPIATAMLDQAAQQHSEGSRRRRRHDHPDECDDAIRRLRAENSDLRRHLEIYEEHLRMLTIENGRQKQQLEQIAGVTDLNARRTQ